MKPQPILVLVALMTCAMAVGARDARAGWVANGVSICTADNNQHLPVVVSDGAGGVIMAWYDFRPGSNADIYAQRVDGLGQAIWTSGGVAVCTNASNQFNPVIVSDGSGGAIIAWNDGRGFGDIYAQRLNAMGAPMWTADGVPLCVAFGVQDALAMASDGAGGAVLAWQDFRGVTMDVYTQRVNPMGAVLWTANGVAVCTQDQWQEKPVITGDGAGGAIIAWEDLRSFIDYDTYAQRVGAAGMPQWIADGVPISVAGGAQRETAITPDGAGGAIIAWADTRTGSPDIRAQRVSGIGAMQWTVNGTAVCVQTSGQLTPMLASDGSGGAIVTWLDYRYGFTSDLFAQRIGSAGTRQWAADGVPLCVSPAEQVRTRMVPDGAGGAVVVWDDNRSGTYDVYAQRISGSGTTQWTLNGALVSDAASHQQSPSIAADGAGGVVIAWNDARSDTYDIYAQRLELDYGTWGHPEPSMISVADVPNDQGGKVAVNWKRSGLDELPSPAITHYSIWRAVDVAAFASMTASAGAGMTVSDPAAVSRDFQGHAVYHERIAATDYYWEWVANQNASHDAAYSYSASTRNDAVGMIPATHYFRVIAHATGDYVLYKSTVGSGASIDNLAPAAPLMLTGHRVGSDVHLKWNRVRVSDLRDYSVYRATSAGVTPVPIHYLTSADDTVLVDAGAPATTLYYIVTAYDVHENQSTPSNEASVSATTGVGQTPPIAALTVLQNHPNPFSASTEFEIGLAAPSTVEIDVFDVAGRRVASLAPRTLARGWQRVTFDGRNENGQPLPGGVYLCRVRANGAEAIRKMVLLR